MIRLEIVWAACEAYHTGGGIGQKACVRITATSTRVESITLCLTEHAQGADVLRAYMEANLRRCAACGTRERCADIRRHAKDKRGVVLCNRCRKKTGELLRGTHDMQVGDSSEWDPHYQPPIWWRYSEKAAAERQRRAR